MKLFTEYHSFIFRDIADSIKQEDILNRKLIAFEEKTARDL